MHSVRVSVRKPDGEDHHRAPGRARLHVQAVGICSFNMTGSIDGFRALAPIEHGRQKLVSSERKRVQLLPHAGAPPGHQTEAVASVNVDNEEVHETLSQAPGRSP
jgi:hypothetical protein